MATLKAAHLFDLLLDSGGSPEVAEGERAQLAALGRQLHEQRNELARLEEVRQQLDERLQSERTRVLESAGQCVRVATAGASYFAQIWDAVRSRLRVGMDGGRAREVVRAVVVCIDGFLEDAGPTADVYRNAARELGRAPTGLDELDAALARVRGIKPAAEKVLAALSAPHPPVDPAALDRAAEEIRRGRFVTPDQARADLRSSTGGA